MAASFRVGHAAACLMCGILTAVVAHGASPANAADTDKLQRLYEDRAKLADFDFAACQVAYEAGTINLESLLSADERMGRRRARAVQNQRREN